LAYKKLIGVRKGDSVMRKIQIDGITRSILPNGIVNNRPLIPDMIVETIINDLINGSDPVLDYTLKMIRDGQ
jgi:hypothetical protein